MICDYDLCPLGHNLINLLKNITTPSSVNLLVEDGKCVVVENIYGGAGDFTGFSTISQLKKSWSILEVFTNVQVGLRNHSAMNSLLLIV